MATPQQPGHDGALLPPLLSAAAFWAYGSRAGPQAARRCCFALSPLGLRVRPGMEERSAAAAEAPWQRAAGRRSGGKRRGRRRREEEEGAAPQEQRLHEARSVLQSSDFWESSRRTILNSLLGPLEAKEEAASEPGLEKVHSALEDLRLEAPASTALTSSPQLLQTEPRSRGLQCVCYGIGNFSSCTKARCQLALLLLLLEELEIPPRSCYIFDPVFSALEREILRRLGLTVLLENEEGKRSICGPTIFYMIHCGKALYNNLLWRNWSMGALSKMVIIGNSFQGIQERVLNKVLQKEYSYIAKVLAATEEEALPDHPHYLDVFNDTSVHQFPLSKLRKLPPETWMFQEEPVYQKDDQLEIIRNE